jgi:flavin reductase (DIM6/NTAB) family NADH-FMN oxidoreductase RutF
MNMDPKEFRNTLGRFATGVTVVTADNSGLRRGMTANAFSSLSLDPPLVLVCVDHKASFLSAVQGARRFAINFLSEEQKSASDWFAGKGRDAEDQFADIAFEVGENGAPLLSGSLANLECETHEELPGGDHLILVGRVTRIVAEEDARPPLLFYAGAYRKMDMDGEYVG